MGVTVIRDGAAWRAALDRCIRYDFCHTWDFHAISRDNGEGSPVLFLVDGGDCGLLLPLLEHEIPETDWLDLTSVYGYPSPLVYGALGNDARVLALWHELLQFLRDQGYVSLFSRGHPILTPPALRGPYYKPIGDVVYIDCSLTEEGQVSQYRRNHRQDIRKLKARGVVCTHGTESDLLDEFRAIYEKTMRSLGANDYYFFSDAYYDGLLSATDFRATIWVAECDGMALSAGFLIYCGEFAQYHLSGTDPDYYKLAPSKLLIDQARSAATRDGKAYLVIGGGYHNREDSLLNFKRGFSDHAGSFYVAKIILDETRYRALYEGPEAEFFPAYRDPARRLAASTCALPSEP